MNRRKQAAMLSAPEANVYRVEKATSTPPLPG